MHYAGEVTYNVRGFLEKNNDLLYRDLREVMSHTTNSIIKVLSLIDIETLFARFFVLKFMIL